VEHIEQKNTRSYPLTSCRERGHVNSEPSKRDDATREMKGYETTYNVLPLIQGPPIWDDQDDSARV
jgi:hypothetical protein